MIRTVILCNPSDLLHSVWSLMKGVDEDSRPIGVLNARDALETFWEEVEYEEVLLREYEKCTGLH